MTKLTKGKAIVGFVLATVSLAAAFGFDFSAFVPVSALDALAPVIDTVLSK